MTYYCSDKKFYSDANIVDALKRNFDLRILYSGDSVQDIKNKYLTFNNDTMSIEEVAKVSKLQAVKMYREQHNCSISEAYEAIKKML